MVRIADFGALRFRTVAVVAAIVAAAGCNRTSQDTPGATSASASAATYRPMLPPPAPDKAAGCKVQDACKYEGRCTDEDGECVVGSEADCKQSLACGDWGTCGYSDGKCIATTDEDCRASWNCRHKGRCRLVDGVCGVKKNSDCKESSLCKYENKCTARSGRCRK